MRTAPESSATASFPIVGIGASAGGLEAFTDFLKNLPKDTGMAFVFIQHLAAGQESLLTDILARSTPMTVHKVKNDMPVYPNTVYVIPPDVSMTIVDRILKLQPQVTKLHRPVDQFLISLAKEAKNRAIGVVLSGTGTDGTEGLKAIYAEGGITFAQDEDSAKYPGMPQSAVVAGVVHFSLPPDRIAEELARIGKHPYPNHTGLKVVKPEEEEEDAFRTILAILRLAYGVDFSSYKESTVNRRLSRRMVINHVDKMDEYIKLLRANKANQTRCSPTS
jgi:two-component system CheB/CheR fusion protein